MTLVAIDRVDDESTTMPRDHESNRLRDSLHCLRSIPSSMSPLIGRKHPRTTRRQRGSVSTKVASYVRRSSGSFLAFIDARTSPLRRPRSLRSSTPTDSCPASRYQASLALGVLDSPATANAPSESLVMILSLLSSVHRWLGDPWLTKRRAKNLLRRRLQGSDTSRTRLRPPASDPLTLNI